MIAEIYNKISDSGSNLSDRLEDKLTGNFLGNMRYLPYKKGIGIFLNEMNFYQNIPEEEIKEIFTVKNQYIGKNIEFWPRDNNGTELDASINLDSVFIGVEVKYNSSFSGENQLLREFKMISKVLNTEKESNKKGLLFFIARSGKISEAVSKVKDIISSDNNNLFKNILFGYLTWEEIYEIISKINLEKYNDYEKNIIKDTERLLYCKGFEKFKNFKANKENIETIGKEAYKFSYNPFKDFSFKYKEKVKGDYYEYK